MTKVLICRQTSNFYFLYKRKKEKRKEQTNFNLHQKINLYGKCQRGVFKIVKINHSN